MSAYAILRHGKIKAPAKGVVLAHNHRTAGGEQPNIDRSLSRLNIVLEGSASARIDALLPTQRRKDAVVAVEVLLTASPEWFDTLATDRRALAKHPKFREWANTTMAWAKAEFGGNLVDAALHMDESSPHIHLLAVPLVDGRLCAKDFTSRAEMQRRQTSYAQAVGGFGLKRGQSAAETKREHIPLKGKPPAAGRAKIKALEAEVARLTAEIGKVQARFERMQALNVANMADINRLEREVKDERQKALEASQEAERVAGEAKGLQKALEASQEALRAAQEAALAAPVQAAPAKALDEEARRAFEERAKGLKEATAGDMKLGKLVERFGDRAIYHTGRGVQVVGPAPKSRQRERELAKGVER